MEIEGIEIETCEGVYPPSEDTFLLIDALPKRASKVMDTCTGTGIIGLIMAKRGANVVLIDNNNKAIECARRNAWRNNLEVRIIKSDLFPATEMQFELITCNPPYLPCISRHPLDRALCGGPDGLDVIKRFINGVRRYLLPGGYFLLVTAKPEKTQKLAKGKGFRTIILKRKRFFFEEIAVIKGELQ